MGRTLEQILAEEKPEVVAAAEAKAADMLLDELPFSGEDRRVIGKLNLSDVWGSDCLGSLVIVERGSSPRPIKKFIATSGGVNWIKIGDMAEGQKYVTSTKEKITEEGALKSRFVGVGDFILSNSMSFGRPYIMAIDGYIHDGWFALRLPSGINTDYFYYLLSSSFIQDQFNQLAVGGVVKNISGDLVKRATLPLPPLAEQKVIADKLDSLLAQVETIKARLDRIPDILKRFRQSVLAAAVSGRLTEDWREAKDVTFPYPKIELGSLINEMRNGLSAKPNEEGLGNPILRISSVRSLSVDQTDIRYLDVTDAEKARYALKKGDLLFTRYNGSIDFVGVCGIVGDVMYERLLYPDKLIRVREKSHIVHAKYLELFSASYMARTYIESLVKSTSGQKGISGKDLKLMMVDTPELNEQAEIVRCVEQLFTYADTIEQHLQTATERVNNLTQSILAKAFRGELTQDWRAANPELISGDNSAAALLEKIKAERAAMQPKRKTRVKKVKV